MQGGGGGWRVGRWVGSMTGLLIRRFTEHGTLSSISHTRRPLARLPVPEKTMPCHSRQRCESV